MLATRLLIVGVLSIAASDASRAQAAPDTARNVPVNRTGSWSAATNRGLTLMGTWTAVLDTNGTVTGTWTLFNAQGGTAAEGAWSAAKSPAEWTGAWRAVISGRDGEYSGTWAATVGGKSDARLGDLFEKALQAVMSGSWRVDQRSGAWSIRTFK